ncbi:ANTAR domain-containing protein [Nocardioides sp.]|uniref:ANTAR domain-containing protein n=1 Tax=Nocardioides sp. TaxID=35761 RepID=UPI00286D8CE0|nr:ANTAR domain-containing protein [Nocardioides sp.]
MSTDTSTPDSRRTANRLLDVLQRERTAAATDPSDLGPSEIHAKLALIERAKGALMLHYGVDSHQALAVLIGWSRISRTPLTTIAHTLLRGICEGNPQTEIQQRALMRWLEAQLRERDPGHAQLRDGTGTTRIGT